MPSRTFNARRQCGQTIRVWIGEGLTGNTMRPEQAGQFAVALVALAIVRNP